MLLESTPELKRFEFCRMLNRTADLGRFVEEVKFLFWTRLNKKMRKSIY